jgi:carbamate kinase
VGGNALLDSSGDMVYGNELSSVMDAASKLSGLAEEHDVVLVHGNGPQVGEMLEHQEGRSFSLPLDVLVAQSQGQIGALLQRVFRRFGCDAVSLVTQVVVDAADPARGGRSGTGARTVGRPEPGPL